MNVPGIRSAKAALVFGAAILGIALLAGTIRVLPWIVAPNVPLVVALPFVKTLVAVGLEATLLCAPPIGWAFAASTLVERGEARAYYSLGVGPAQVVAKTLVFSAGFAALSAMSALSWGTEVNAPGRLSRSLVQESKRFCDGEQSRGTAHVPFVGVTWLCFRDRPPRLSGSLPGSAGAFTASDLTMSDDLRTLRFSDMRVLFAAKNQISIHVAEAEVTGLSPWGRPSNLSPGMRALLLCATGALLSAAGAFLVLRGAVGQRILSLLIGGSGPVAALLVMSRLEQTGHAVPTYLLVPAAGLAAQAAAFLGAFLLRLRAHKRGAT